MSTAKQVSEIVQPFLEQHPEFELVGRSVVMKPVRHLMRRFFIDRTSIKGYIQPIWSVSAIFGPPPKYTVSAGARMTRGAGYVERPETQVRLLKEMEVVAWEILNKADAIDGLPALAWKAEPIFGPGKMTLGLSLIAKGKFTEATPYVAEMLARVEASVAQRALALRNHRSPDSRPAQLDAYALKRSLEAQQGLRALHEVLGASDPSAVAALLHEWEAACAKVRKVEHLWEPSPFPFELPT